MFGPIKLVCRSDVWTCGLVMYICDDACLKIINPVLEASRPGREQEHDLYLKNHLRTYLMA
jgi:hypothetical protein